MRKKILYLHGLALDLYGGHRMNAEVVRHVLIPFIHELKILG